MNKPSRKRCPEPVEGLRFQPRVFLAVNLRDVVPISVLILLPVLALACSALTLSPSATSTPEPESTFPEPELTFEQVTTPLLITPESLPEGQVGLMYEAKIQITQNVTPVGEMMIQAGDLPAGLEFVFLDGEDAAQITGVPNAAGLFEFTVYVWCYGTQVSGQTLEKKYQIVVQE